MKFGRKCLIKLVKLKEEPTSVDLERQLQTLIEKFDEISCSQKHVNLILQTEDTPASTNKQKKR